MVLISMTSVDDIESKTNKIYFKVILILMSYGKNKEKEMYYSEMITL